MLKLKPEETFSIDPEEFGSVPEKNFHVLPHPTLLLLGNEKILDVQRALLAAKHSVIFFDAPEIPRRKSSVYLFKSLFETLKKTRLAELKEALPPRGYWMAFRVEAQLDSIKKRDLFAWVVKNNVLPWLETESDVRRFYQFTQQHKATIQYVFCEVESDTPLTRLRSNIVVTVE